MQRGMKQARQEGSPTRWPAKLTNLEQRVQDHWVVFEKKRTEQMVQPDDKEAVITQAEHRIKVAVQRDAEERWKNRVANEDRITTHTIEVLRPIE